MDVPILVASRRSRGKSCWPYVGGLGGEDVPMSLQPGLGSSGDVHGADVAGGASERVATGLQVVGGAEKGGIIVREQVDLASPALSERLATGSQVKEWGEKLVERQCVGAGLA